MALTYCFGMTARKIRDILPTAKTAEDKDTLCHAPLTARTNLILLPPARPLDFPALAKHIDALRRDRRMPEGTKHVFFYSTLNSAAMDSIAGTTQDGVREAAAECRDALRLFDRDGYPLSYVLISPGGAPSLTHLNPGRETIYSNLFNAPLRITAPDNIAPREYPSHIPPRMRGKLGAVGKLRDAARAFEVETGTLARFADERHPEAAPVWHQHEETKSLALALEAHR